MYNFFFTEKFESWGWKLRQVALKYTTATLNQRRMVCFHAFLKIFKKTVFILLVVFTGEQMLLYFSNFINLFRMCLFGPAHGWGESKKAPSLKSVGHILQ